MIYCQDSFLAAPIKLLNISFKGIETEPRLMLAKKHVISTSVNTIKELLYVAVFDNYFKDLKK